MVHLPPRDALVGGPGELNSPSSKETVCRGGQWGLLKSTESCKQLYIKSRGSLTVRRNSKAGGRAVDVAA